MAFITDYKDLFKSLDKAVKDYAYDACDAYDAEDVAGLLEDRLKKGKERLDDALEVVKALCEPVEPPREQLQYQRYFVGNPEDREAVKDTEPQRRSLYKAVSQLVRAYANVADDMEEAGYHPATAQRIFEEVKFYKNLKQEVLIASDEYIDLKRYEPGMRQLIDYYIGAEESRTLSTFDNLGLIELIVEKGKAAIDDLPPNMRKDKTAMAETIESNLRKVIIEERPSNPAYYEKMSVLLDELIQLRKEKAIAYEQYLKRVVELAGKTKKPGAGSPDYPSAINTEVKRALYDNLYRNEKLTVALDEAVRYNKKDAWRDNKFKKKSVKFTVEEVLNEHGIHAPEEVERIFNLIVQRKEY